MAKCWEDFLRGNDQNISREHACAGGADCQTNMLVTIEWFPSDMLVQQSPHTRCTLHRALRPYRFRSFGDHSLSGNGMTDDEE